MLIEWKVVRGRSPRNFTVIVCVALLYLVHFQCGESTYFADSNEPGPSEEHVCPSLDIRNNITNFNKLENCTVIEGYLHILLIHRVEASQFANLSFPKLREITGYFLLFRVSALTSLKTLFPNLSVIRGSILFHNFAFVVFEMLDLERIDLPSLTDIVRGAVRIEKNPKLCYLNTVDWGQIASSVSKDEHFIDSNGKNFECPDKCSENCPKDSDNVQHCWNNVDCQKKCDASVCGNRTCSPNGGCCHEGCLGGCWGGTQIDCFVCRKLRFNGTCMDNCPPKTYQYHDRRCLTDQECISMSKNITRTGQSMNYKPFHGFCTANCPKDYKEDPNNRHNCIRCDGRCPKECNGGTITTSADAQRLEGCTLIKGPLQIQVSGREDVVKELEKNLNLIEEITGYLKVARSSSLKSLNFLKSLKRIGIEEDKLTEGNYALYVLDNRNLEELWDWHNRSSGLKIEHGKIFFHFNPKLCIDKIRELENYTNLTQADVKDVSLTSNGDQIACNVSSLELSIVKVGKTYVMIRFTNFLKAKKGQMDFRSLLGYMISYKEVPEGEVNLFDDYDSCATTSANTWTVFDLFAQESYKSPDDNYIVQVLTNLNSYTRYAIYVKTYTIASEKHGGKSSVIYFRTQPAEPTPPVNVAATADASGGLLVSWKPPMQPNGDVTHYRVTVRFEDYNQDVIYTRDYCTDPQKTETAESEGIPPTLLEEVPDKNKTDGEDPLDSNCCPCSTTDAKLKDEEGRQKNKIEFENYLHNAVYISQYSTKREQLNPPSGYEHNSVEKRAQRKRRNVREMSHNYSREVNQILPSTSGNVTEERSSVHISIVNTSEVESTSVKISDLKHFSKYIIRVVACHNNTGNETLCSQEAIISARTKPALGADNINQTSINVSDPKKNVNSIFVKWESPPNPNGLILSFNVETRRSDGSHNPSIICVSYAEYLNGSGTALPPLQSGDYLLRLQAISMFGPGNWTTPYYFYIPEPASNLSPAIIGVIIVGILAVLALFIGFTYIYVKKKYFSDNIPDTMQYTSVNPEYLSAGDVYIPDDWEIDREKINLLRELGQGSFGMVYEGEIKVSGDKSPQPCAVKTVNDSATLRERIEFLNEASVMKAFSCNHVVRLIGVVSKGYPTYVVMELMRNGDLKTFLRNHRPDQSNPATHPPSVKRILQMAMEIADGMAYLADKKYVHRDLAARNCMVAEDLTVKIGDFGMTRDIYETDYYRKGGKGLLPVRWMAPESLKDGVFTSQSDVWSYGVVLWEMATLASQPYQGLSNEQVLKYVIDGGVMEKPENCLPKLYDLMRHCWHYNPASRPTFLQLIESLLPDAQPSFLQISFYSVAQERARGSKEKTEAETDEEDGQEVTPSTPLRSPEDGMDVSLQVDCNLSDEHETGFRPKSHMKGWSSRSSNHPQTSVSHLNEGSKGMSISSSDGSKDSKTSQCSANGSIINGRVGMQWPKGREC